MPTPAMNAFDVMVRFAESMNCRGCSSARPFQHLGAYVLLHHLADFRTWQVGPDLSQPRGLDAADARLHEGLDRGWIRSAPDMQLQNRHRLFAPLVVGQPDDRT